PDFEVYSPRTNTVAARLASPSQTTPSSVGVVWPPGSGHGDPAPEGLLEGVEDPAQALVHRVVRGQAGEERLQPYQQVALDPVEPGIHLPHVLDREDRGAQPLAPSPPEHREHPLKVTGRI